MSDGWVASDATSHTLEEKPFSPTSLVSVAVSVEDREEFNTKYREIVSDKCSEYDIPVERPVIKDSAINKHVSEWEREDARKDIVESLLQIDTIANIHFTETTLGGKGDETLPAYQAEPDKTRVITPGELRNEISPYYNLISIWDYFDRIDDVFKYRNVMVDDFDGKDSFIWRYIGSNSNELHVIPKGDRIYPLLSIADLTMEYVKQEVSDWSDDEILNHLVEVTPGDSAFVKAFSIDSTDKLHKMAPLSTRSANTQVHYPHPMIFFDTGDHWHKKEVEALDLYEIACEYASQETGAVKFIDERADRDVFREGDIIICMDESRSKKYKRYSNLNSNRAVDVLTSEDAMEEFQQYLE